MTTKLLAPLCLFTLMLINAPVFGQTAHNHQQDEVAQGQTQDAQQAQVKDEGCCCDECEPGCGCCTGGECTCENCECSCCNNGGCECPNCPDDCGCCNGGECTCENYECCCCNPDAVKQQGQQKKACRHHHKK